MAVFRVEKNKGYTVMSNHHLRNKDLTLKAKGLLSQMLSLPETWDYTLAGLSHINRESIDAIRTAVWELEKAGYITRQQGRDDKGKMTAIEYIIYEQPQPSPVLDYPILENPTTDKPILENPTTDNPTTENPMQLNKEVSKTNSPKKDLSNTEVSNIHSIPIHSPNPLPLDGAAEPERNRTETSASAVDIYRDIIKDNIEYDIIADPYKWTNETVSRTLERLDYLGHKDGSKIYDPVKRQYKCNKVQTTYWNEQTRAEEWRAAWAEYVNGVLEHNNHAERIDHRSYDRQGIEQIPTVHLGVAAFQMEKRGICTERGDINREIEVTNQRLRQLKARIVKLQSWLKEETENTEPPTLADYIQDILSRKAQAGKSQYSQSLYNLKDAANMLNFLTANKIMDMAGLDEKFKSMIGEQMDIRDKLKPVERRLTALKKHIEQSDIYLKYKSKKALADSEQILFMAANNYLKGVMNGKTTLPTKAWKSEYAKLTAERNRLNQRYIALKDEVKEAEQIRKSVYSILRQEQREQQPRKAHGIDR